MTLVALVALGLLSFAVGLLAPIAEQELRVGRSLFRSAVVTAAARSATAELEAGGWLPSAGAVPVGGTLSLGSGSNGTAVVVARELRRIGPNLWLGAAEATLADPGGGLLARSRQGVLLQVTRVPPDTIDRVQVTSRPWVDGFE
jgi:hypothetical protein